MVQHDSGQLIIRRGGSSEMIDPLDTVVERNLGLNFAVLLGISAHRRL